MDNDIKQVLNGIVNGLENLAVSLDALESALIHRGQLKTGEIAAFSPICVPAVVSKLADLRLAISSLR